MYLILAKKRKFGGYDFTAEKCSNGCWASISKEVTVVNVATSEEAASLLLKMYNEMYKKHCST